jgi:co-chaperonin GroES (HSP10)
MDLKKLKMMGKNVLVVQEAKEKESAGGIIIAETDTMKAKPRGVVIAVGCQVQTLTSSDRVIWGDYAGQIIKEYNDGTVARIMTEDDILAVIDE